MTTHPTKLGQLVDEEGWTLLVGVGTGKILPTEAKSRLKAICQSYAEEQYLKGLEDHIGWSRDEMEVKAADLRTKLNKGNKS